MPRPDAAARDADWLRHLVADAYDDGNAALRELAQRRRARIAPTGAEAFRWNDADGGHAIAAALFHAPYALRLQTLELSLYGYCVRRRYGWERVPEAAFSLRRPRWWGRVLRPAPLLELTVTAGRDGAVVSVGRAARPVHVNRAGGVLRLEPALQRQLLAAHEGRDPTPEEHDVPDEPDAAPSLRRRVGAWLRRLRPFARAR